jgi:hypothetical protein
MDRLDIGLWFAGIMAFTLIGGGGLIWIGGKVKSKVKGKYRRIQPKVECYDRKGRRVA